MYNSVCTSCCLLIFQFFFCLKICTPCLHSVVEVHKAEIVTVKEEQQELKVITTKEESHQQTC